MGRVAIVGVGHSKFGKRTDASLRELAFEAYSSALDDAELESPAIDGSIVCSATHYDKQRSPAGVVAEYAGIGLKPPFTVNAHRAQGAVVVGLPGQPLSFDFQHETAFVGFKR